jgi:hypothetical protein
MLVNRTSVVMYYGKRFSSLCLVSCCHNAGHVLVNPSDEICLKLVIEVLCEEVTSPPTWNIGAI